eukprot:m.491150 g.491150  ORF g.491150 m.491150 type:complete len:291 (+) comp57255_c0_seq35:2759-3631(+)
MRTRALLSALCLLLLAALVLAKSEYEMLRQLHLSVDDDKDGTISRGESDDFIQEELRSDKTLQIKDLKQFHTSGDGQLSVDEVFEGWLTGSVRKWSVSDVQNWFLTDLRLPEYISTIKHHQIDGKYLLRFALHDVALFDSLKITKDAHRQKIALRSTDLILFGAPDHTSFILKATLAVLTILLVGVSAYFYNHANTAKREIAKLRGATKDLELVHRQLQEAELKGKEASLVQESLIEKKADEKNKSLRQELEDQRAKLEVRSALYFPLPHHPDAPRTVLPCFLWSVRPDS